MEEERISPGLFSLAPKWIKFDKYELTEDRLGEACIIPVQGATMEFYRPFQLFPEILRDFLQIMTDAKKTENMEQVNKITLRFVNRYGLLGLFRSGIHSFDETKKISFDNGKEIRSISQTVKTIRGRGLYIYPDIMYYDDYMEFFFPRSSKPYPRCFEAKDLYNFWKDYSEPIKHILRESEQLFQHAEEWQRFVESECMPEDECGTTTWANRLRGFGVEPIGLYLEFDGKWQLEWGYKTLMDALRIMYLNDITSQKQHVRLCKSCGRSFIANSPKAKYCSTACGVNERVRKLRSEQQQKRREK